MLPGFLSRMASLAALATQEASGEVHLEDQLPVLQGHLPVEVVPGDAGVVDHAVQAA
jgi:hypothetical protein